MKAEKPVRTHRLSLWLLLVAVVLAAAGCDWSAELGIGNNNKDDNNDVTAPVEDTDIAGLSIAASDSDFDTTQNALSSTIAARYSYSARIDHQSNAAGVNLNLRLTTELFFDDPNRSAPLIAADPRVALDLPAKVLVYRDSDNNVGVAYNNAGYLDARYDLGAAEDGTLDGLDDDMRVLAEDAAGNGIRRDGSSAGVSDGDGIERVDSDNDFTTTLNNLVAAINARAELTLVTTIDETARALAAGRAINPSTLVVFGNPSVGTLLIQSSQTTGIDLPQKMLVSQDDNGDVRIYYNNPAYIADRHNIDNRDDENAAIANLLESLARDAASTNSPSGTGTATTPGSGAGTAAATSPGIIGSTVGAAS